MPKMKALVATNSKATPKIMSVDAPEPAADQVLVEVAAASLNPVDQNYAVMHQIFKIPAKYPLIMGNDFSGTIVEIGKDVTEFAVGDEVYGRTPHDQTGTFAEFLAIDTTAIAKIPQNIELSHAAAIPLVGLTAYQALFDYLQIKPGQKVFIGGGSGGVGSIAIQLAKNAGAFVATTISEHNRQMVEDLGADELIDYHKTDFSNVLHDYDAVFDTHGGDDTAKGLRILHPGGKLVTIAGMPEAGFAKKRHLGLLRQLGFKLVSSKQTRVARLKNIDYHFLLMSSSGQQLAEITKLIEAGKVHPVIDTVFPFSNILQALEYSKKGHSTGKIIVKVNQDL
jgi:alcohol dehydrogenase